MENAKEFEQWLNQCLEDAKDKLQMTDRTIAYILLTKGMNYYLKQLVREEHGIRDAKKYN